MKPRILVVEDNDGIREMLGDRLTEQGWDVTLAADGEEGLALATQNKFEVISTDFEMPKLDGVRFTLKTLAAKPHATIYMFSGSPQAEQLLVSAGGKKFFDKTDPSAYVKFLKAELAEIEDSMCGCDGCEEEDCFKDCDSSEQCMGCFYAEEDRKDQEFEFAKAQGRA